MRFTKTFALAFISAFLFCSCSKMQRNSDGTTERHYFYANGAVMKKQILSVDSNGNKVQYWKYYFQNGNLKKEGHLDNNKAYGIWKFYDDSGVLGSQSEFSNGIREGEILIYWANGEVKAKGYYENDELNGPWISYYDDGSINVQGNMIRGKEHGEWIKRDKVTGAKAVLNYRNGILDESSSRVELN